MKVRPLYMLAGRRISKIDDDGGDDDVDEDIDRGGSIVSAMELPDLEFSSVVALQEAGSISINP
jgi:hypothetical protein